MPAAATYLYVPGDAEHRLQGSGRWGAHAVLADLEDAVAPARKDDARLCVAEWLRAGQSGSGEKWVRVNPGERGLDDIEAVWNSALQGICLAKTDSAVAVVAVAAVVNLLEELEGKGREHRTVLMPLIESADGLRALREIASFARVAMLQLGEIDLAADLGMDPDEDGTELLFARSQVVVESRASRIAAPVGGVYSQLDDPDGLMRSTRRLQRLGFGARAIIHPQQVEPVQSVFAPSEADLRDARDLVAGYDETSRLGQGVFRDAGGRMIDEAVVRRARALLRCNEERDAE